MIPKQMIKDLLRAQEEKFIKDAHEDKSVDAEAVEAYLLDFVNTVIDIIDDNFPDCKS